MNRESVSNILPALFVGEGRAIVILRPLKIYGVLLKYVQW